MDQILQMRANIESIGARDELSLGQAKVIQAKLITCYMMERSSLDPDLFREAMLSAREAIGHAAASGDQATEAAAWNSVGQLLNLTGEMDEPVRAFKRAANIYLSLGFDEGVATCCVGLAGLAIKRGDANEAVNLLRRAIRHNTRAGNFQQVAIHKEGLRQLQGLTGAQGSCGGSAGAFCLLVGAVAGALQLL